MSTDRTMDAYQRWVDIQEGARQSDFHTYASSIANARFVTRRVIRIVSEQAKQVGDLDPLQHQALLHVYGSPHPDGTPISKVAARLDVTPAFASRLISQLQDRGLVDRHASQHDRRVIIVVATAAGIELLQTIDASVHEHVAYFQHQLDRTDKITALAIFAFYVGLDPQSKIAAAIRDEIAQAAEAPRT